MSTFTVYCHGTGFNRVKGTSSNELVAWFHNHNAGVEATLSGSLVSRGDYLINEGPGHSGGGIDQPQQVNPMTGSAKQNLSLKKVLTRPTFADHAAGKTGGPQRLAKVRGAISGQGWDENTQRTVNIIQDLKFEKGQAIDTVNLVGWSRGAVTCMRIANLMWEVFKDEISCNIFAVDPVAGADAGEKMADTQKLEANVENYVGILAMHEMRSTFKPQDWSRVRAPDTTCIFRRCRVSTTRRSYRARRSIPPISPATSPAAFCSTGGRPSLRSRTAISTARKRCASRTRDWSWRFPSTRATRQRASRDGRGAGR